MACTMCITKLAPNSAANARFASKLGSSLYLELQASNGTCPYFPGTAVVHVGEAVVLVVRVGVLTVVEAIMLVDLPANRLWLATGYMEIF